MATPPLIDITFDVRSDAGGKDPDSHSKTLRRYHQLLWSKPLPGGASFELDAKLGYGSGESRLQLASDSFGHTYSRWSRPERLVSAVAAVPPGEMRAFYDLACTVGAYIVFPLPVRIDGRWRRSINQARGMHARIRDRFDLTLECIRRHYGCAGPISRRETSPLASALEPYAAFFELFGDFRGYVDHFLLQDLVTDHGAVRFFTDFSDFTGDALPAASAAEYREYMTRMIAFIHARNARIARYARALQKLSDAGQGIEMSVGEFDVLLDKTAAEVAS